VALIEPETVTVERVEARSVRLTGHSDSVRREFFRIDRIELEFKTLR
jgi:hypothetical protein